MYKFSSFSNVPFIPPSPFGEGWGEIGDERSGGFKTNKNMKTLLSILVVVLLISCGNKSTQSKSQKDSISTTIITRQLNLVNKNKRKKTNFELVQGKWYSSDDKTNYLIFENNHRKEIA